MWTKSTDVFANRIPPISSVHPARKCRFLRNLDVGKRKTSLQTSNRLQQRGRYLRATRQRTGPRRIWSALARRTCYRPHCYRCTLRRCSARRLRTGRLGHHAESYPHTDCPGETALDRDPGNQIRLRSHCESHTGTCRPAILGSRVLRPKTSKRCRRSKDDQIHRIQPGAGGSVLRSGVVAIEFCSFCSTCRPWASTTATTINTIQPDR